MTNQSAGQMPERDRAFIEAECLKVALTALGCSDLKKVDIGPLEPEGSGPNWRVIGFLPELPALARDGALEKIAPLRGSYSLQKEQSSVMTVPLQDDTGNEIGTAWYNTEDGSMTAMGHNPELEAYTKTDRRLFAIVNGVRTGVSPTVPKKRKR